jgi:hypothetical protein
MQEFHKERTARERAEKKAEAQAAKDEEDHIKWLAKEAKREKKLDKKVNDVLPFFDSKMVQCKKTKDITLYTNLICEFIFEDANEKDGMNHSEMFDFQDVPHRTTVYEMKVMFSDYISPTPAW